MTTTTLTKVVSQYLNSSDRSDHEFARIYNIAVRGLENEFNLDICGHFVTVLLDVNPNKTVELPVGFLNYSKIGIVNEIGEFVCLKRNDQLSNYHGIYYNQQRNKGVPSITAFANPFGFGYYAYNNLLWYGFWNNGTSFNLYGLDSGTAGVGYYKIDVGNNLILLNPDFPYQQVLLEYLSDGYNEGQDDYTIDSRAAEAMLAWIRWQSKIDQPKKTSLAELAMLQKLYYAEKRKAKVRINPFNLAEMNDIVRRSTKLTPKA